MLKRRLRYPLIATTIMSITMLLFTNASAPTSDINTIDLQYTYNLDGDTQTILDLVDSTHNENFDYDGVSRLTSATFPNATTLVPAGSPVNLGGAIAYSKTGDITSYTEFGKTARSLAYDPQTQWLKSSSGPESKTYSYDGLGDITTDSKYNFTYRLNGHLVSVSNTAGGSKVADYTYDDAGIRVKKVNASGRTTYYVSSGNQLLYEATSGGTGVPVSKEYFYVGTHMVGARTITGCTTACTPTIEYNYYHFNPVSSTIGVSKSDGSITRERYNTYGSHMATTQTGPVNTAFNNATTVRFAGHETDDETGLSYMGARYYDPTLGRFLSPDPNGFDESNIQSFNKYSYANNNPNKFLDPDGREAKWLAAFNEWWDTPVVTDHGTGQVLMTHGDQVSMFLQAWLENRGGGNGVSRRMGGSSARGPTAPTSRVSSKPAISRNASPAQALHEADPNMCGARAIGGATGDKDVASTARAAGLQVDGRGQDGNPLGVSYGLQRKAAEAYGHKMDNIQPGLPSNNSDSSVIGMQNNQGWGHAEGVSNGVLENVNHSDWNSMTNQADSLFHFPVDRKP